VLSFCLSVLSSRRFLLSSRPASACNCYFDITTWQSTSALQLSPWSAATPPTAMQNAGLALAAICDSFRHSHPWCHQYPPVLISSVLSRDADLPHRANGHAALFFATLRKFYFLSPVDSTHLCSSTFAVRLGTQLRLCLRTPCASERACYQSLGLHIYLLAAALLPWPIAATSWLPLLVPRLPHTYRLARRAARSGAV
jgi:hypothetical protein